MAIYGRALREAAADRADEARHPGRGERRRLHREAHTAALADMDERFPTLTGENFEAALAYQNERIRHHEQLRGVTEEQEREAERRELRQ
jgi:hypothetical protein